jgi:hypothetical protein
MRNQKIRLMYPEKRGGGSGTRGGSSGGGAAGGSGGRPASAAPAAASRAPVGGGTVSAPAAASAAPSTRATRSSNAERISGIIRRQVTGFKERPVEAQVDALRAAINDMRAVPGKGRIGSPERAAGQDLNTLYRNASIKARNQLARTVSSTKHPNEAAQGILRDLAAIRKKAARGRG